MTNADFPASGRCRNLKSNIKPIHPRQAKVLIIGYPPLKANSGSGAYRNVPWINLKGHWLEQAGFAIGTPYTIKVYDGKLVFIAEA